MPPLYVSSTREASLATLPEPLASALRDHAARNQLRLDGARCWITHRVNPPAAGFVGKLLGRRANPVDPDAEHDALLVLHPTHLVVGAAGAKRGCALLDVPLERASVSRGSALAARIGAASTDDGLTIAGFAGHEGQPGTWFFALGAEPAAEDCARAVEGAIVARKNRG